MPSCDDSIALHPRLLTILPTGRRTICAVTCASIFATRTLARYELRASTMPSSGLTNSAHPSQTSKSLALAADRSVSSAPVKKFSDTLAFGRVVYRARGNGLTEQTLRRVIVDRGSRSDTTSSSRRSVSSRVATHWHTSPAGALDDVNVMKRFRRRRADQLAWLSAIPLGRFPRSSAPMGHTDPVTWDAPTRLALLDRMAARTGVIPTSPIRREAHRSHGRTRSAALLCQAYTIPTDRARRPGSLLRDVAAVLGHGGDTRESVVRSRASPHRLHQYPAISGFLSLRSPLDTMWAAAQGCSCR